MRLRNPPASRIGSVSHFVARAPCPVTRMVGRARTNAPKEPSSLGSPASSLQPDNLALFCTFALPSLPVYASTHLRSNFRPPAAAGLALPSRPDPHFQPKNAEIGFVWHACPAGQACRSSLPSASLGAGFARRSQRERGSRRCVKASERRCVHATLQPRASSPRGAVSPLGFARDRLCSYLVSRLVCTARVDA